MSEETKIKKISILVIKKKKIINNSSLHVFRLVITLKKFKFIGM